MAGRFIDFEAKIDGKGGEPLSPKARKQPEFSLKAPLGVNPKEVPTELPMKAEVNSPGLVHRQVPGQVGGPVGDGWRARRRPATR